MNELVVVPTEYWYRAGPSYIGHQVRFDSFEVYKHTPQGVWISRHGRLWLENGQTPERSELRWVCKTAKKRYAHPTKGAALEGFYHRNRRYIKILEARLAGARETKAAIARMRGGQEQEHKFAWEL